MINNIGLLTKNDANHPIKTHNPHDTIGIIIIIALIFLPTMYLKGRKNQINANIVLSIAIQNNFVIPKT